MKKNTLVNLAILTVFLISFINPITLLISMVLSMFLLKQGYIGAIKLLNIITLRGVINPGIAVEINQFQNIKWIIIFICSFILISGYKKILKQEKRRLNLLIICLLLYSFYSAYSSLFVSGYPIVAFFKVISFSIPCLSLFIGVSLTSNKFNWIDWMFSLFFITVLFSLPLISNYNGYLRNGISFGGLYNELSHL